MNAGECFINYIINSANRIGEDIDIAKCIIKKIKVKKPTKSKIKSTAEYDNVGYCGDYCLKKFDVDFMIKNAN